MKLPFSKKKDEFDISSVKATAKKANGETQITQIIPATVIEVGDDEAEGGFSYKYTFTNPLNQNIEEATDFLQEITIGEQLFEVGDKVNVFFTATDGTPEDFSVTRQMVFPHILRKKKIVRTIVKVIELVIILFFMIICCIASQRYQANTDTQQTQEIEIVEEQ